MMTLIGNFLKNKEYTQNAQDVNIYSSSLGNTDFSKLDQLAEQYTIRNMKEQFQFIGEQMNLEGDILIVSDRLQAIAQVLTSYLIKTTNTTVRFIDISKNIPYNDIGYYDILIVAGYLGDEENYSIVDHLHTKNKGIKTVMWAHIDGLTKGECRKHKIAHLFPRNNPLKEFAIFLNSIN